MQVRHLFAALAVAAALPTSAQTDWNAPFPPHKVMGNLYFVGTEQLGSFLVATPEGLILINSDFESTVPFLRKNVEALGFKFTDIKILLGSHAHGDHMQGDALVKELTGAEVMAMAEDVPALRAMKPEGKEHPIDRVLHDGDKVQLGGTTLIAHLTPGHTAGCTSWEIALTEDGRSYTALIVGSFGVNPNYVLVGDKANYPGVADDYRKTFAKARAMDVDVFLGSHGSFYSLPAKYAALEKRRPGEPNPFVDPAGFRAHIDLQESRFEAMLAEQAGH
jgi:metallo-beta-lactamase class B